MKKENILVMILLSLMFLSCSSDNSQPTDSLSEILTQKNPWVLDRVEIENIENDAYIFTDSEINEEIKRLYETYFMHFTFYDINRNDYTDDIWKLGLWESDGYCPSCEIIWNLEDENTIGWAQRSKINFLKLVKSSEEPELIWTFEYEDYSTEILCADGKLRKVDYYLIFKQSSL
tara:strand:+ start:548 stop:1072 length:525 start_codon:yes stop_codon:yes gene_type:complete